MPQCERCLNTDLKYFAKVNGLWICRRCISFQGQDAKCLISDVSVEYSLPFSLTIKQKEIAQQCMTLSKTSDVLINAVCGAGKTELVMDTIKDHLNRSLSVGIAVARRQVALQLFHRLKEAFPAIKVIVVCEGHTQDLEGRLIVTTTHQLYRFRKHFDCLVLDEPDAFPFRDNPVLNGFMKQSVKGHIIYLSATPDKKLMRAVNRGKLKMLSLMERPHQHPLPIPGLIFSPFWVQVILLKWVLRHSEQSTLIFVPSLKIGHQLAKLYHYPFAHASSENLDELINCFKEKRSKVLITTTVLERGVTFSNIQVVVIRAEHRVFDLTTLIQIAGRAGRDPAYPKGEVKFLCSRSTSSLRQCCRDLRKANMSASIASVM